MGELALCAAAARARDAAVVHEYPRGVLTAIEAALLFIMDVRGEGRQWPCTCINNVSIRIK